MYQKQQVLNINNNGSSKIPFWSVYEIWEFNLLQQKNDTKISGKQKCDQQVDNEYLVQMTAIQDTLYILIQDEQNYLYQYDTKTEIFDEVNAGGIPPKERTDLSTLYHDNKIYVFGTESSPLSHLSLSQSKFICLFDLLSEEWTTKEASESDIPQLPGQGYCSYGDQMFYLEQQQELTVIKRNLDTLNGLKHRFPYLKSRESKENGLLCYSEGSLYIYNIDYLYRIDGVIDYQSDGQLQQQQQSSSNISGVRLDGGQILSESNGNEISLKGFSVIQQEIFSLVQMKNKIAILSINLSDLQEYNSQLFKLQLPNDSATIQLIDYFNSASFSDLKFKLEGAKDMYCSRQLLSHFSKYFRKHLSDPEVLVVKINDVGYNTFQLLLQQFYYQFANELSGCDQDTLLELFTMANKFSIPLLQEKCEKLVQLNEFNYKAVLSLIKKGASSSLKDKCLEFLRKNKQLIGGENQKQLEKQELSQLLQWFNNKQCLHKNTIKLQSELKNIYTVTTMQTSSSKSRETSTVHSKTSSVDLQMAKEQGGANHIKSDASPSPQVKEIASFGKYQNFQGIIKEGELDMVVCLHCKQILNYE